MNDKSTPPTEAIDAIMEFADWFQQIQGTAFAHNIDVLTDPTVWRYLFDRGLSADAALLQYQQDHIVQHEPWWPGLPPNFKVPA